MKIFMLFIIFSLQTYSNSKMVFFISQAANSDWRTGDVISLDFAADLNINETIQIEKFNLNGVIQFQAGYKYEDIDSVSFYIPTQNSLFCEGVIKYNLGWVVDPYISVNARTQVLISGQYNSNKFIENARWRDPAETKQELGFSLFFKDKSYNIQP